MINWNKYFDKIYIITYTLNFKKREMLEKELKRINLNDYEYVYSINSNLIRNLDAPYTNDDHDNYGHGKYVTFTHYETIKKSYELGYERILILEDDIRFLNDINLIEEQFEKFYLSHNIILYDYVTQYEDHVNDIYAYYLSSAYSLNKNGMKCMIDSIEDHFWRIDYYFFKNVGLTTDDGYYFPYYKHDYYDIGTSAIRICLQYNNDLNPIDFYFVIGVDENFKSNIQPNIEMYNFNYDNTL